MMTNGSVKIAVDVGYGLTKALSSSGLMACFPSAAAPADLLAGAFGGQVGYRVSLRGVEGPAVENLVGGGLSAVWPRPRP